MAFRLPFFKPKEAPPAASTPAIPPPILAPAPAEEPPPMPSSPEAASVSTHQGSLASALKAATSHTTGGEEIQSSILRPKVSVNLKNSAVEGATPSPEPAAPSPLTSHPPELMAHDEPTPPEEIPSSLELAVADIIPLLPPNILNQSPPKEGMPSVISIPTADIIPQLAMGKVQVSLDALIATFPTEMVDASVAGSGDIKIKIPLHLIIPKLPTSAISLPDTQIRQQVGASIGTPFSERTIRPGSPEDSVPPGATMIAPRAQSAIPKVAIPPVAKTSSLPPPLPRPSVPAPKVPSFAGKVSLPPQASPIRLPPLVPVAQAAPPSLPRPVIPTHAPATPPSIPPPSGMPSVPPIKLPPPSLPPAMVPGATIPTTGPVPVRTSTLPLLRTSTSVPAQPSPAPVPPPEAKDEDAPTPLVPPAHPSEAASVEAATPFPQPPTPLSVTEAPPAPVPEISAPSSPPTPPAAASHLKQTAPLREILEIAAETPVRLQDLADKILQKMEILGVLIVAEDGLLLTGSLPPGLDSSRWSCLAPQLFRKFAREDKALPPGRPRRCFLEVAGHGFSLWNERGIYLVFCHRPEKIGPEFDENGGHLACEIALFCQRHGAAA